MVMMHRSFRVKKWCGRNLGILCCVVKANTNCYSFETSVSSKIRIHDKYVFL